MKAAIATFVLGPSEILSSKDPQVHRAMSNQTGDQQGEAFQASKIEIKGGIKFVSKMVVEHSDFGRSFAMQAFS